MKFLTRFVWQVGVAVASLAVVLGTGCFSNPEQKYRVLSYFLDGVPLPPSMIEREIIVSAESETGAGPTRPRQVYVKHQPYEDRECESCHRSKLGNQLVAALDEICWICHDEEDFEGDVTHGPVASGQCVACHDPHKSPNEYMLRETGSEICGTCHDPYTFEASSRHGEDETADCLRCHNPHASDREYMLRPGVDTDLADRDRL